jgi:paraquat-inducible protein B
VPTTLDELRAVLSIISRLPLEQMGRDLSESLAALRETTQATNTLLQRLDRETASELNRTLAQTRETLKGAENLLSPNSPLQSELYRTLREFGAAARSFRLMADYLERHPEALLRGKEGTAP